MNMKMIITIVLLAFVGIAAQTQTIVKGHVINEQGAGVGYVSIGIEEDSVGVISDAEGYFTGIISNALNKISDESVNIAIIVVLLQRKTNKFHHHEYKNI